MDNVQAFPLQWPEGVTRTPLEKRVRSQFKERSIAEAVKEVQLEVDRAGGRYLTISTNIATKKDGTPYSDKRSNPEDTGVAVYFERKGRALCFPCDRWKAVSENLYAIALHINAIRGQERWGVADAIDRAFEGYAMLTSQSAVTWKMVLWLEGKEPKTLEEAERNYKTLARLRHPDQGGSHEKMAELNEAIQQARRYFGQ
jgi:hypothetical protein